MSTDAISTSTARPSLPLSEWFRGGAVGLIPVVAALIGYAVSSDFSLGVDDSVTQYQPAVTDTFRQLRSGRLPLWTHHMSCGLPHFIRGGMYPGYCVAHAISSLTIPDTEVVVCHMLHIWLGVLGSWLFLRNQGCRTATALIGAIGFGFSGPLWGFWTNWSGYAFLSGLIPPTLFAIDRVVDDRRSVWNILGLAICTALIALVGDPLLMVKFVLLAVGYSLLRIPPASYVACGRRLSLGFAVGGLLGSVQCWAVAEWVPQTTRIMARSAADFDLLRLRAADLPALFDPLYIARFPHPFFDGQTWTAAGIWIGPMLPFVLYALLEKTWWTRPVARALTVLMFVYPALTLGTPFPPNRLLMHLPLLDQMRWPLRWMLEFCSIGPLVIGLAVEDVLRSSNRRRALAWSALGCLIAVALQIGCGPSFAEISQSAVNVSVRLLGWLVPVVLLYFLRRGFDRSFAAVAVGWTLCVGVGVIPLMQQNRFTRADLGALRENRIAPPIGDYERVLTATARLERSKLKGSGNFNFNFAGQFGGRSVVGYWNRFHWQTWATDYSFQGEFEAADRIARIYFDPKAKGLLQLLRVGAVVLLKDDALLNGALKSHPDFEHIESTPWVEVYRHHGFRRPAWFVSEVLRTAELPDSDTLSRNDSQRRAICTVADQGAESSLQTIEVGEVRSFHEDHDRIDIGVATSADGFLVVNTTWHPDWKATADGRQLPTILTDGGFIGIPVTKDVRSISLRFKPIWSGLIAPFAIGFWVVLVGWIIGSTRRAWAEGASGATT